MNSSRNSPFVFSNELTRCLNLLESVKHNMPLVQEVIKHIRRNKESVSIAMKVLMSDDTLKKHGKQKLLQMVLAIWTAFPNTADASKVISYLSTMGKNKFIRILQLKIILSLIRQNRIDIEKVIQTVKDYLFEGCVETDYLILTILIEIAENRNSNIAHIREVLLSTTRGKENYADSLCAKIMHICLITDIPYKLPVDLFDLNNRSLYIRILDTISFLGTHYPKDYLFTILPEPHIDTIKYQLSNFLQKSLNQPDYTRKHGRKIPFANNQIIQRIKDTLTQQEDPSEIVKKLKIFLHCQL